MTEERPPLPGVQTPPLPPGRDLLYKELQREYDKTFELKDSLDGKANNMITISSAVATLLFGFGTFLVDRLASISQNITIIIGLLAAGIILNIASMMLCIWVSKISLYTYAIGQKVFSSNNTNEFNTDELDNWKSLECDEFQDAMIESYLNAIRKNDIKNFNKAHKVKVSQFLFIFGIFTIPSLAIILGAGISNENSLNDKKLELLYYKEAGQVTNHRILAVSSNSAQVESSLISAGFVNGTEIESIKTMSYFLEPNNTITDGYGYGVLNTPGRAVAYYSMNFSGHQRYDGLVTLSGTMSFSDKATGRLGFISDRIIPFKAKLDPDNNFLLHSVI
jgi:hypothetical protein